MASLSYRRLDENNEPVWGLGKRAFLSDLDALAQLLKTRIMLFLGEFWLDTSDGTPMFQSILGVGASERNLQQAALLLQQRIENTQPFVSSISDVEVDFNGNTRQFIFSCNVQTQFGTLSLTNAPITPESTIGAS